MRSSMTIAVVVSTLLMASAMPSLDNGHPVAEVTLVHADDWKVVIERLD